jgi:hypothetical protein
MPFYSMAYRIYSRGKFTSYGSFSAICKIFRQREMQAGRWPLDMLQTERPGHPYHDNLRLSGEEDEDDSDS